MSSAADRVLLNKQVIRRLFDEVLNANRVEVLASILSPSYQERSPIPGQLPGIDGVRQRITALHRAVPSAWFEILDLFGEENEVCVRWQLRSSNPRMRISGIDIYRFEDGRILEHWAESSQALR